MPRPICFMVMPFGEKPVQPPMEKAPDKINFDRLWEKALLPVIKELGYEPVRADQDVGALIIHEMLERLYFSDLVLADMTIPNGNVYYEVGVRHASKKTGCVLVSADWTKPLFDVNQMRRVTYPLPEGQITDETATGIRAALKTGIENLAAGDSPLFQALPGYPTAVDPKRASSIRRLLEDLSAFQAKARAVRLASEDKRREMALKLRDENPPSSAVIQSVALDVLYLLRDCANWEDVLAYIDSLPQPIRDLDVVYEQRCLAQSKTGDHLTAIAALEELIKTRGDSSERQGLIGGRYKKLAAEAKKRGDDRNYRKYLDLAIAHYEHGIKLDLNDYYPTSNLPRLYRERNRKGDEERALVAAHLTCLACERAKERNPNDEWVRPTLLGMAFDAGDVETAERLVDEIRMEGPARWKLDTTLADLERSVAQLKDPDTQSNLCKLLQELQALL